MRHRRLPQSPTLSVWVAKGVRLLLAVALLLLPAAGHAETVRSREVPRQFMATHPCPGGVDGGRTEGRCQGYVRDHIIALCVGGPDTVANMQWQTVAQGKAKDRWECKR